MVLREACSGNGREKGEREKEYRKREREERGREKRESGGGRLKMQDPK